MVNTQNNNSNQSRSGSVSLIPLGDIATVTKNMFLYETENEIMIVDCGIGFADETLPGVDLLIPDVTYLKNTKKKIVGMILTHGHEDHIGAVPFVIPQLPDFPIYATPLTAEFTNEKLKDFGNNKRVKHVSFDQNLKVGPFDLSFVRVTHSVVDAANILIKTPAGTIYHGSDYKIDFTPHDKKPTELHKIARAGEEGIMCLLSDCLGSTRKGHTPTEIDIQDKFDHEFKNTKGKVFLSTYSSNISRLNQAIEVGLKYNRKVCIMGRSFLKARDVGRKLGYMNFPKKFEVQPHEVPKLDPSKVLILVAGSQGQVDSGLVRIASNEDRDISIAPQDKIIISSDPIPGNEANVYALIDLIVRSGAEVIHTDISRDFHVSGHGSQEDIKLMMSLTKPRFQMPIGGNYRHMVGYRDLAQKLGYKHDDILIPDNGQEIIFENNTYKYGRTIQSDIVFVDQITGEEMEDYVVFDRVKISQEGILIVLAEISEKTGKLVGNLDLITRGFSYPNTKQLAKRLEKSFHKETNKKEGYINLKYYRKMVQHKAEQYLRQERRQPLVIPVILEV